MRVESELKKRSNSIHISNKAFVTMALLYVTLPVVIFFLGYLKPVIAAVFSIGFIVGGYSYIKCNTSGKVSDDGITIKYSQFVIITIIMSVLMFFTGVGEFCSCTNDHDVRYAILNDLIKYKWPIVYDFDTQTNPEVISQLGEGKVAFAYYFAYWMIPALVGKVFGLMAARVTILVWTILGMWLVTIGLFKLCRKSSIFTFLALFMFAGLDIIPFVINTLTNVETTFEGWNLHLFIHGNYYQLVNVYNQSIPGWIITILLMNSVSNKAVGFLGGLMFCYSPWATIGILPLCICELISKSSDRKNKKVIAKEIFTLGNIITPVIAFVCFATLYTANSSATSDNGLIWKFYDSPWLLVKDYIWYIIFEFGLWVLLIYKANCKNPLFWTSIGTLLVLPVYKISIANDFIMRGSLAPMFVISILSIIYVSEQFEELSHSKDFKLRPRIAVLMLVLSAFVAANTLLVSSASTIQDYQNGNTQYGRAIESFGNIKNADQLKMVRTQFYVYDYEDTIFFKYLAR